MAIQPVGTLDGYQALLAAAGFAIVSLEDLTEELRPVLRQRFAMYQVMRREAEAAGTPTGSDTFHRSYARYAELFEARRLGGVRATAIKPWARARACLSIFNRPGVVSTERADFDQFC